MKGTPVRNLIDSFHFGDNLFDFLNMFLVIVIKTVH